MTLKNDRGIKTSKVKLLSAIYPFNSEFFVCLTVRINNKLYDGVVELKEEEKEKI